MIQQLLLWANFSACFCYSSVNQQLADVLAPLVKAALFLILGCGFPCSPLRVMQFKDLTPYHSEILISLPRFVSREASACLCSLVASTSAAGKVKSQGSPELNPWDTEEENTSIPTRFQKMGRPHPPPPGLPFARSLIQSCLKAPMPRIGAQAGTGAVPRE